MKKSEAKKLLDTYFKERLEKIGFRKGKSGFIKVNHDFFISFGYSLVDLDNSFTSQFGLYCGFRSIDRIYNHLTGRSTDGINLFSLSQSVLFDERKYPKLEYELYSQADVEVMVNEVVDFIEKDALSIFENLSTITKLEQIRNRNPIPQQALTGLILAKVVSNPNYEALKSQYRQLLKDWPESDKQELEKVIAFLDQHNREELLKIAESQA